jgi:hypothetical protein
VPGVENEEKLDEEEEGSVIALKAAGEKTEKGTDGRAAGAAVACRLPPRAAVSKPAAVNWKGAVAVADVGTSRSAGSLLVSAASPEDEKGKKVAASFCRPLKDGTPSELAPAKGAKPVANMGCGVGVGPPWAAPTVVCWPKVVKGAEARPTKVSAGTSGMLTAGRGSSGETAIGVCRDSTGPAGLERAVKGSGANRDRAAGTAVAAPGSAPAAVDGGTADEEKAAAGTGLDGAAAAVGAVGECFKATG